MPNFMELYLLAEEERNTKKDTWEAHERNLIDGLVVAIIEQAVVDYEKALCNNDMAMVKSIEGNARRGDIDFTSIPLSKILRRVRIAKDWFDDLSAKHECEIEAESHKLRKDSAHNHFELSAYRCPLCGGGMYMTYNKWGKRTQCSGCSLFTWIERKVDGKVVRVVGQG